MKRITSIFLTVPLLGSMLSAQVPASPPPPPAEAATVPAPTATTSALFTADQLDQLLGPIALYPDALIAIILPASTNPSDVVLAARFLDAGGLPSQVSLQPWDDSVRALANYPQLARWMDQNLAWTKQLGEAFAAQPGDVMGAIQRLRERARAAGTLTNTPQQQVVVEDGAIVIVPANPSVIYIPYYDPTVVYGPASLYYPYSTATYFSFSSGFATGWWLCYGFDWHHRRVWTVNHNERERYWREHQRDWHRYTPPLVTDHSHDVHVWRPHNDPRFPLHRHDRPAIVNHPAPGFDRGREGPRFDHDRDGTVNRPWRHNGTPSTAFATPRVVGPTAREHVRDTPTARLREVPALAVRPWPSTGSAVRPLPNPVSAAHPTEGRGRGEFQPRFQPRPYTPPAANAAAPSYAPPRQFAPPAGNAGFVPPQMRMPAPRPAPAMHVEAPRSAPAMHYSPPPAPAPQQAPQGGSSNPNTRPHDWRRER